MISILFFAAPLMAKTVFQPWTSTVDSKPGLENFHTQDKYKKARAYAKLSQAVYELDLSKRSAVETEIGTFEVDEDFSHDRYQVYYSDELSVLVFRGTQVQGRIQEDLVDADFKLMSNFWDFMKEDSHERTKEASAVAKRFLKKCKQQNKLSCDVSGHSLGGTLALHASIYNEDIDSGIVFNPGAAPMTFHSMLPWLWQCISEWQEKTARIEVMRSYGDFVSWDNILGTVTNFANPFNIVGFGRPGWCIRAGASKLMLEHAMTNFTEFNSSKILKYTDKEKKAFEMEDMIGGLKNMQPTCPWLY